MQFVLSIKVCLFRYVKSSCFSLFLFYCLKISKQSSNQNVISMYICIYIHKHTYIFLSRKTPFQRKKKKLCLHKRPFNQLQECCTNYFPTEWPFHLLMAFWNKIALTRWECYVCHISNSIFSLVVTEQGPMYSWPN